MLPLESAADAGIHFATWQSLLVMAVTAVGAVMAHYALAVFNDGARPFLLDFIRGKTTRMATATIVFGLSAGFIFGLGAPMALSTGVLNPWLIFLPAEILGLMAPWPWLAAASGIAWGAVCSYGLVAVNNAAASLPVDFITALQEIGTPILWLFAMFPVLAVARQFGRLKGVLTFAIEILTILLSMYFIPNVFAGSLAMAIGVVVLIGLAIAEDLKARRAVLAETKAAGAEAMQAHIDSQKAQAEMVGQLFGPNAMRLRKRLPMLMILGGAVAALAASQIFGGGEATSFMMADGKIIEAAQVDFYRAFGFIPLIATTALASGAYAMAGFTFVYPVGYMLSYLIPNHGLAVGVAFVAGALVFAVEIYALSAIGAWLQRWPSIRDSADHIRNGITDALQTAILVGSLMAGLAMGGGVGIFVVGGLYLLNESLGRPVVKMAAGPAAVLIGGVLLNLAYFLNLFQVAG